MLTVVLGAMALAADDPSVEPDALGESPVETPVAEPVDAPLLGRPYSPTAPGQVTVDSPYWDLEVLYEQERHLEGEQLARRRYHETKDPHLTLHIARFAYQRLEGDTTLTRKEREAVYVEALSVLDEGIAADPDDTHLRFARGVVLARLGTTRGVLSSLRLATDVESAWLATIESDYRYRSIGTQEQLPCDAYLALGIFYRLVPDMWLVKAIAGTKGDLRKSLELQTKGAACAPTTIRNLKELGVTQLCIGTSEKDDAMIAKGKATIERYLTLEPTMEAERVDLRHGRLLLADPDMACGYSRDGQQDLDESKLEKQGG
jgi:hypothetical protein